MSGFGSVFYEYEGSSLRTGTALTRRELLRTATTAAVYAAIPSTSGAVSPETPPAVQETISYLATLARPDDGYGWFADGQGSSHLTPTFAVVGSCRLLRHDLPDKNRLAAYVRAHHPFHIKKLERPLRVYDFQQIQSLLWLGEDVGEFRETVRSWREPADYPAQYERHGYPVFGFEALACTCRSLLGLPLHDLSPKFTAYFNERRRAKGSFNNTPASDGSEGNVLNTWHGIQALAAMKRLDELRPETISWLQDCQLADGGFTHAPKPEFAGCSDAAYVRAAVRSLDMLGSKPRDVAGCVRWLQSLRNGDGGYGDQPGWNSNPLATYYVLDALATLKKLGQPTQQPKAMNSTRGQRSDADPPDELQAFTIQIESHGKGSPAEAVALAKALKIHLWGAKNASPAWLARAQAIARQEHAPVTFLTADEEYGTWVDVPGLGTYSHTSDVVSKAGAPIGPSLANKGVASWPEYRERRWKALDAGGGMLIWQFGENEEIARLFLDDSLMRGGFAAISTFHFGNPDFTNSSAFLQRYRGKFPFVALQDAHGNEPWWFADMTTGFRTVFLATEPTWQGWLAAVKNNWVAAVRHDAVSGGKTWIHSGSAPVERRILKLAGQWQWWDNPEIDRPAVSLVDIRPGDEFEVGRPTEGVALRVRCAWENTAQGLLKRPLTEFVRLLVDGQEVTTELVTRKAPRGESLEDRYHLRAIANPAAGKHVAEVVVRSVNDGKESSKRIEFVV